MIDFAEALREAAGDSPERNISIIKGLIVDNLRTADASVRVRVTDHFNHSFVPDMLLSWPGVAEQRQVFLRTAYDLPDLMRDVDLLADEKPILMSLSGVEEQDVESAGPQALAQHSARASTLITDPAGLDAFGATSVERPVVSLFSHAVLQGGRGVLSSTRARQVSDAVGEGFSGAQEADFAATSTAVEATEALLDNQRASQMTRLLHAVWVGSGASGTTFPGAAGITAVLDADALNFVLGLDIADDEFWQRLGRGLTTGRLCELGEVSASDNFQRLLAGNAHRLQAKACRVSGPTIATGPPKWSVSANTLVLDLPQARVHFAPRRISELPSGLLPVGAPPSVDTLATRAAAADVEVEEVRLSNGDATLAYSSDAGSDVSQDSALSAVAEVLSESAVTTAVARVGTAGRSLRCSFSTGTATGNSSAKFYVAELATVAVPLLVSLDEDEQAVLKDHVSPERVTEAAGGVAAAPEAPALAMVEVDSHSEPDDDDPPS